MKLNLRRIGYALISAAFVTSMAGVQASATMSAIELAQASPTPTPAPAAPTPPAAPAPAAPAPAPRAPEAGDVPLYERVPYISTCRQLNATTEVFQNTALGPVSQRVGTVNAGAQVTLTGVLGNIAGIGGVAQIKTPVVGWLRSSVLTTCGTPPVTGSCYIIRTSTAPNGLYAYSDPITAQKQLYGGVADGPAGGSRVYFTSPPTPSETARNTIYVKVSYTSLSGSSRIGWISQGPVGSTPGGSTSNLSACP
ncbi:MAG TPA: hypothetical protein V6C84_14920 [Coleofasciculaceae cyanobacterium]|jgi:hypothetical protein